MSQKTFTSNLGKLQSWQKFRNRIACEFTAHYACKNAHRDESTTTNGFNFRIINTLMGSWQVRLTWLDYNQRYLNFGWTLREDVRLASTLQIFPEGGGDVCTQVIFIEPTRNLMNNRAVSSIPCGTKFFREFIFADMRFFVFCGN